MEVTTEDEVLAINPASDTIVGCWLTLVFACRDDMSGDNLDESGHACMEVPAKQI